MRFFGSLFHSPPSAEYTRPNLTNIQVVYKHIFDHLLERGDLYKRDAFSGLETTKACLPQELYLKLRVDHDALSIQRETLADATHSPNADLVSRASRYKNAAKSLYWRVHDLNDGESHANPNQPMSPSSALLGDPALSKRDIWMRRGNQASEGPNVSSEVLRTLPRPNSSPAPSRLVRSDVYDVRTDVPLEGRRAFAPTPSAVPSTAFEDSINTSESMAWLDTQLKSLNHSVDVHTVKGLLLSIPPDEMDDACKKCFADMMTGYGHMDGEGFMQEFTTRRLSCISASPRSSLNSSSYDGNISSKDYSYHRETSSYGSHPR